MKSIIICGDSLEILRSLPNQSCKCCVISPPYFHLRDYNVDGQIGMETTLREYIERLVTVFHEVKRVLTDDGTLWVNIADSYGQNFRWGDKGNASKKQRSNKGSIRFMCCPEYKPEVGRKSLMGIPWRLAFALQDDGWVLRQDIIWNKTNCMPESVRDRCTKSHEYIFLLAKKPVYFFNHEAIMEPVAHTTSVRMRQNIENQIGSIRAHGGLKTMKAVGGSLGAFGQPQSRRRSGNIERKERPVPGISKGWLSGNIPYEDISGYRNKRDVWNISTSKRRGLNHYATFPEELAENCILAGSEIGDTILDPFMGIGTAGMVALKNGRKFIGIDINPEYCALAEKIIR